MNNLVVKIFEWQLIFCKGDCCAATMLSFLIRHQDKEKHKDIKSPVMFKKTTLFDIFSKKFDKVLINNSLQLLEQLNVIKTQSTVSEAHFIFNINASNKWFAKYSKEKTVSDVEPSLDIIIGIYNEDNYPAPADNVKTHKANEVINKFLMDYNAMNSNVVDNVHKSILMEPLILNTITTLREMIY